jgi:hypothetical protein
VPAARRRAVGRGHTGLDAIAEEHGLMFSEDATTVADKIDALEKMGISPAKS